MRVVLLTSEAPVYMPRYLKPVLDVHADDILKIVNAPNPDEDLLTSVRKRNQMLGPVDFLRYAGRFTHRSILDFTQRRFGLDYADRYYSVAALADAYEVEYQTVFDVNSNSFISQMRDLQPKVILSIACGQLLGEDLLSVPEFGAVNIHGSLLPKYRGRATAFWVLYHDEDESGVTAHFMNKEFDQGEIILQRRFPIAEDDTMDDVYNKIVETGAEVAIDVLKQLPKIETSPNRDDEGVYYSLPDREARKEFKRRGKKFL